MRYEYIYQVISAAKYFYYFGYKRFFAIIELARKRPFMAMESSMPGWAWNIPRDTMN
jgi:hypothetical protein